MVVVPLHVTGVRTCCFGTVYCTFPALLSRMLWERGYGKYVPVFWLEAKGFRI